MTTLVVWAVYIYVWMPLVTLGAWGLEFGFIHRQPTTLQNLEKFRGVDRRRAPLPVTTREVANDFHISPSNDVTEAADSRGARYTPKSC
jgi:hypothetical protein